MAMIIKSAQKIQQKARVCLWGVEKVGKTHAALDLATALANGGKIGVISSERGSSSLLARRFPHEVIDLTVDEGNNPVRNPFSARRYEEALNLFVAADYAVIIVDSLTHLWEGEGGILEVVSSQGGEFQKGWDVGSPMYQKFLNKLLGIPAHLIVTLRAKDGYVMEEYTNRKGERKTGPKNAGLAPAIRKYFGFEMQFMIRMEDMAGRIVSSAYQEELPKGTEIESFAAEFAPALSRFLEGAPPPERIPSLQESYKRGLATGAWAKETFYHTVSKALGVALSQANVTSIALSPEQLKRLAELAEAGAPVENQNEKIGEVDHVETSSIANGSEVVPHAAKSDVQTAQPAMPDTMQQRRVIADDEPITESQRASINKLCERLGCNARYPDTHGKARAYIAKLSAEYKERNARKAS